MAVAIPVTSVLSLLAFTVYLLWLHPLLAVVSFAIYPVAVFVLPVLQRRANMENKKRVDVSRDFSGKLAGAITGVHEIQVNAAHHLENKKFEFLVSKLQKIRIALPDDLQRNILKARTRFREGISADFPDAFSFYRKSGYSFRWAAKGIDSPADSAKG